MRPSFIIITFCFIISYTRFMSYRYFMLEKEFSLFEDGDGNVNNLFVILEWLNGGNREEIYPSNTESKETL